MHFVTAAFLFLSIAKHDTHAVNDADKVVLCHKPDFYTNFNCGKNPSPRNVADLIMLDVAKIPFNLDQWFHIDVLPTQSALSAGETLKIKHAMIQVNDKRNYIFGRIGEQIPCEDSGHPQYLNGQGEMSQLYRYPGVHNFKVIECPIISDLSKNLPPSVGVFTFPRHPVEAFYVNVGFTKEEGDFIKDGKGPIIITTMLVDETGDCYLHRVEGLMVVPNPEPYQIPPISVPVKCHHVGPALQTNDQNKSPLRIERVVTWDAVEFGANMDMGIRPDKNFPHVSRPDWNNWMAEYNLVLNGLDREGHTARERAVEAAKNKANRTSSVRNPNVPLVAVVDDDEVEKTIKGQSRTMSIRKFDADDEECDDNLRVNKPENAKDAVARVYLDCVYSKECTGEPEGCLEDRNCDFVVAWGKEADYLAFEVIADKVTYVAVGVSEDDKMGNDSVTECNREDNDIVAGYTSWNFRDGENLGNIRLRSCVSMKDFTGAIVDQTKIYCRWKRPFVTTVKGQKFDLNQPYYVLAATGHTSVHGVYGNIAKHELKRVAVRSAVVFNKYIGKSPLQHKITRLHGITMLITWMVIAPVAVFVPRYLKGTFVTKRIKGYSVWYGIHMILVTATIILSFATTIVLFILNNYDRAKNASRFSLHSILGMVMGLMLIIQMILAYVILDRRMKWKKQWNIKFFHGMVGHMTVICGYACIFLSRYIKDGLPCNVVISYSMYLVFTVILHLLMSYQICYSDFVRGHETSRIYKIFIVDRDEEHDQPRRPRRRKTATLQAEVNRRRRLTLDEIENVEDGQVINPTIRVAPTMALEPLYVHEFEKEQEEPGAMMRRVILLVFLFTLSSFALYFVILILLDDFAFDCPSQDMLEPGVQYEPGRLYF